MEPGRLFTGLTKCCALAVFTFLAGCANPYEKFYTDNTNGVFPPHYIAPTGEPIIRSGNPSSDGPIKDNQSMLEDGYGSLGYSSFTCGCDPSSSEVDEQAKKVNASVVLIYKSYSSTHHSVVPIVSPTYSTTTTNASGSAYGSRGSYANYNGSATSTTTGSQTTYIPQSTDIYSYFATYWVKMKRSIFGVYIKEMDADTRARIQSNKGVEITVVKKGSPAFLADIFKGDIIQKMNNLDITDDESLTIGLEKFAGQQVDVVINRNGNIITKKVQFNTRD